MKKTTTAKATAKATATFKAAWSKEVATAPATAATAPATATTWAEKFAAATVADEATADLSHLKEMTAVDAELRSTGKPRFSTSMLRTAPVPAEGEKTKIYDPERRAALFALIAGTAEILTTPAALSEVFVNYWHARKLYTISSYGTEKGFKANGTQYKFAAVHCEADGTILDTPKITFGNTRKEL